MLIPGGGGHGFLYVFWIRWVSPANSPVRLGVSLVAATPIEFYSQRFWGFICPHWNLGFCSLSCSPVVPPSLSAHKCETTWSASCCFASGPLHPSCCCGWMFLLYLLGCWTFIQFDFWQFWFFFVFKFVVVLLVVRGGKVYLPMPPSWSEVLNCDISTLETHIGTVWDLKDVADIKH